jgi:hypothetical protein
MTHDNADAKFSTKGIFETKRITVYVCLTPLKYLSLNQVHTVLEVEF